MSVPAWRAWDAAPGRPCVCCMTRPVMPPRLRHRPPRTAPAPQRAPSTCAGCCKKRMNTAARWPKNPASPWAGMSRPTSNSATKAPPGTWRRRSVCCWRMPCGPARAARSILPCAMCRTANIPGICSSRCATRARACPRNSAPRRSWPASGNSPRPTAASWAWRAAPAARPSSSPCSCSSRKRLPTTCPRSWSALPMPPPVASWAPCCATCPAPAARQAPWPTDWPPGPAGAGHRPRCYWSAVPRPLWKPRRCCAVITALPKGQAPSGPWP